MARKPFSQEARAKGYRALLKSTSKRAEGLKAYARKWLREHGYSASIVLLALMFLAAPAHAQRANTIYADQFRGQASTVGGMVTLAQNGCATDTAVPCQIILDSILAVFPAGVIPTPCAQCIFVDYRTIGQVKIANNAAPTLTQAWPPTGASFPLIQVGSSLCTAPNPQFSSDADITTGVQIGNQRVTVCIGGVRKHIFTSVNIRSGNAVVFCWSSNTDADSAACDTGLSRGAPNEVDCGNGTGADKTCAFKAGTGVFTGAITVASCAGCGGAASSIMTAGCFGPASSSATLGLFQFGGDAAACTGVYAAAAEMAVPRAGTVQNFRVRCSAGGVNASSGLWTMLKNNVAQTITVTQGTALVAQDLTHTFTVVAGDTIGVKFTTQASETLDGCHASWEVL